jgi:uncharacterized membrane protein YgcG
MMHFLVGGLILLWILHRHTPSAPVIQQRTPLVATPVRPPSFWDDAGDTGSELNISYPAIPASSGGAGGSGGGGAGGGGGGVGGGGHELK